MIQDPGLHSDPKSRHTRNLDLEFGLRDPRSGTWTPNLGLRDPIHSSLGCLSKRSQAS